MTVDAGKLPVRGSSKGEHAIRVGLVRLHEDAAVGTVLVLHCSSLVAVSDSSRGWAAIRYTSRL
jgi:hypothetical protein